MSYCVEVWGNATQVCMSSIAKLQKRAIRIIVSANYKAHTEPIFTQLELLTISNIYKFSVIMFMYKYTNHLLPTVFNDMFTQNYEIHNYPTRQHRHLHVPRAKISAEQRTVRYTGTFLWNHVSGALNCDCTIFTFKQNVKKYLLSNIINLPY